MHESLSGLVICASECCFGGKADIEILPLAFSRHWHDSALKKLVNTERTGLQAIKNEWDFD